MTSPLYRNWWRLLSGVVAIVTMYFGVRQLVSDEVTPDVTMGKVFGLILFLGLGVVTIAGLIVYRSNPRRGAGLVMLGVSPLALVGGLGLGLPIGVIASLVGDTGWWWLPTAVASAGATVAGIGAFGAWWNAARSIRPASRTMYAPAALILVGLLLVVGGGMAMGLTPLVAIGAGPIVVGAVLWSRRLRSTSP